MDFRTDHATAYNIILPLEEMTLVEEW